MPTEKKGTDKGGTAAAAAAPTKDAAAQRTTFRPPWVKEGPSPLPTPTQPWNPKNAPRRDSNTTTDNPLAGVQLRKTERKPSITPKEPQENGSKENTFVRPQLKKVPPKEEKPVKDTSKLPPVKLNSVPPKEEKTKEAAKLPPVKLNSVAERRLSDGKKPPLNRTATRDDEIDRAVPATRNALVREESMRRLSQTPAAPPMPPMPPMMPPPPPPMVPPGFETKPLTEQQKARIEALKARPKNRPDWTNMLKEIESKKKLKHVECNDRSEPVLPEAKATDHFLYESETPNVHNELLKQIQGGIHLKKTKTNDRSKPILEGLRKFRRQMTIEEQIQKSVSMASMPPEEITDEVDEMDDIDKVRDDLQSTKQMLALELRNKEAQIRENKRLLTRIQNLEAELEKERNRTDKGEGGKGVSNEASEKMIKSLKNAADQARKTSEELEKKYTQAAEALDSTKAELEDAKRQKQAMEKKLMEALGGKRLSISDRKDSLANGKAIESEEEIEEESSESDGEETEEKREKKAQKELKSLRNKLRSYKNKEDNAKKERVALREIIKKHQIAMKEEKKKYKILKKEVDKMAAMMKDVGSDEEEEESEEEEVEDEEKVEEEESESSEESESEEESDEDSEQSQSEPEDAPTDKKKKNVETRAKRHENILNALKKGNYLLKTNAERLQDDLNKQKEMTAALQEDLDSVLAELG